jgi:hypothetical protein
MKKISLLLAFAFASLQVSAQEGISDKKSNYPQDIEKKHEVKINAFNLIVFAALDISYERLINDNSSFGLSVFYNFSDFQTDDIAFPKKFSITPYYRRFFSENRYARGFFIEGFGMLNTYQNYNNDYNGYDYNYNKIDTQTGFALGISVGGKFVLKEGFTAEVLLGVGRNLVNEEV